jgi:hypothetical protein
MPQINGICERFHKTTKNEFCDSVLRKKKYTSLEELQTIEIAKAMAQDRRAKDNLLSSGNKRITEMKICF